MRHLEAKLDYPATSVRDLADAIRGRRSEIEAGVTPHQGSPAATAGQDESTIERFLPHETASDARAESSSSPFNKTPEYAAAVTLESLAWGRQYGSCYPHRRCNCYSYRSPCELISIGTDSTRTALTNLMPGSRLVDLYAGVLPSLADSMTLIKFHISHLAWHHCVLHTPTFLEQCEEFWNANTVRHPLWMALYLSILSVSHPSHGRLTLLTSPRVQPG